MVTYIPKCVVYANAVPLQRSKKCETVKKGFQKHLKQTAHYYVSEMEWKFQNFVSQYWVSHIEMNKVNGL